MLNRLLLLLLTATVAYGASVSHKDFNTNRFTAVPGDVDLANPCLIDDLYAENFYVTNFYLVNGPYTARFFQSTNGNVYFFLTNTNLAHVLDGAISLSGQTNRLTDDGTRLLYNGNPLGFYEGALVTNVTMNFNTTTNIYVDVFNSYTGVTNYFEEIYNTFTNVYQAFNSVTNLFENTYNTYQSTTNIYTNVVQNFYSTTNVYNNTTVIYTNGSTVTINGLDVATINPTALYVPYRLADTTNELGDSPFYVEDSVMKTAANLGAAFSAGAADYVNMREATRTNNVIGAVEMAHATNGLDSVELTHVEWFFNGSGSDQTLTINSLWRTNVYSAVPPALTNDTITVMYVKCLGSTPDAASQTNCYVSFEYYK